MSQAQPGTPSATFLQSVLAKRPAIAVFDCDGTLWSGDAGADFFQYEIAYGLLPKHVVDWVVPRYKDYKAGRVDEYTMCAEMVTIHEGIPVAKIREVAAEFFAEVVESRIFAEMRDLCRQLAAQGTELWAVSSTNDWVVDEGVKRFGIAADRVLAACTTRNGDVATGEIVRVPTDEHKAIAIREVIQRPVDAVFGNSVHDFAMLEIAKTPYAINPNPDLEETAKKLGWNIYWPEASSR